MILKHIALTYRSQARADRFLTDVLGLERQDTLTLPASLVQGVFGIAADIPVSHYRRADLHVEVFLYPEDPARAAFDHVCVAVGDRRAFLERCRRHGMAVTEVPKGDKLVTFVSDGDGHRFEIKET